MESAIDHLGLFAKAYTKILKVSRTIADLGKCEEIESRHVWLRRYSIDPGSIIGQKGDATFFRYRRAYGFFRGLLDSRAKKVTEGMKLASAKALAGIVRDDELREDYIVPDVLNRDVYKAVASAVMEEAKKSA